MSNKEGGVDLLALHEEHYTGGYNRGIALQLTGSQDDPPSLEFEVYSVNWDDEYDYDYLSKPLMSVRIPTEVVEEQ